MPGKYLEDTCEAPGRYLVNTLKDPGTVGTYKTPGRYLGGTTGYEVGTRTWTPVHFPAEYSYVYLVRVI